MRANLLYLFKNCLSAHEKNSHCVLYIPDLRMCDIKSNQSEIQSDKNGPSDLYVHLILINEKYRVWKQKYYESCLSVPVKETHS